MMVNRVCIAGLICLAVVFSGCLNNFGLTRNAGMSVGDCDGNGIAGKCVVSYFDADGSVYLTEQQHSFCGSSKQMTISSAEPEGDIAWKLSDKNFSTVVGADIKSERVLCDNKIARVLMMSMLAGADMLGGQVADAGEAVKIEGKWYEPIEIASYKGIRETAYRSVVSKRIDMVELVDESDHSSYISYCYNYKFLKAVNKTTPTKLEVSVKNRGQKRIRLLQVEYTKLGAI